MITLKDFLCPGFKFENHQQIQKYMNYMKKDALFQYLLTDAIKKKVIYLIH
jgi:hypothetical protein